MVPRVVGATGRTQTVKLEPADPNSTNALYWINFHEPTVDARFLGAAVVKAPDPATAILTCWRLKINPGGSPYFHRLDPWVTLPRKWCNRLLAQTDCDRLNAYLSDRLNEAYLSAVAIMAPIGVRVHPAGNCQTCNHPDYVACESLAMWVDEWGDLGKPRSIYVIIIRDEP